MNHIGPEAKSLFEAARNAEGLPGPKRASIKQAVLLQAATMGAASTVVAGGAVAMSMAAKVTLVTVTAAVLGGGSVSVWAWKKHRESTHAARAVPTQSIIGQTVAAPTIVKHPPAAERPAPSVTEPQRRALPRAEARRVPASPSPVIEITPAPAVVKAPGPAPASLDSELNLLRQAQEDLRLGLPAQALQRLTDFDRRFPRAKLDQERQAIEAIATCQLRPGPVATSRAQRFLQQAPLSPLAARVRSACRTDENKSFNETNPRREP